MPKSYRVIISDKITPPPSIQEISAAQIIMKFLQTNVYFVQRSPLKTADLKINGAYWEIKSPIGGSKRTIQNNLREASRQSSNVIIDLRRCKMPTTSALARIRYILRQNHSIKKLIAILRDEKSLS